MWLDKTECMALPYKIAFHNSLHYIALYVLPYDYLFYHFCISLIKTIEISQGINIPVNLFLNHF